MSSIRDRLGILRRKAEETCGAMRQVADHLEEIADGLPSRDQTRRLVLRQNIDRLRAAADLLTAEVNAGDPWNVGRIAAVAAAILVGLGPVVGGVAEGVSSTLAQRVVGDHQRARECATALDAAAISLTDTLRGDVGEDIAAVAARIHSIGTHPSGLAVDRTSAIVEGRSLREADQGMRNLRQRLVSLGGIVDEMLAVAGEVGDAGALETLTPIQHRLAELRALVEVIAVHDESLTSRLDVDGGSP